MMWEQPMGAQKGTASSHLSVWAGRSSLGWMKISGPAKPSSSVLMELMAIPQRNMVEFTLPQSATAAASQPLHPSARGLTIIWVGRDLEDHTELQGWSLPPFPSWGGLLPPSLCAGICEEMWGGGESRPGAGGPLCPSGAQGHSVTRVLCWS